MPKLDAPKAVNPRYDAMKSIIQNRLNDTGTETGNSLREEMEAQGVEMVDLDSPIEPELKDSDSHLNQSKTVEVDMDSKTFTPDVEDIKTEIEPPAEDISLEPKAKVEPEPVPAAEPAAKEIGGIPVYEKDGTYYTKIKVDGQEEEVEFDKLVASAQKDVASFNRFQEAARKEQELNDREAKINAAEAKRATDTPTQPEAGKETGDTVDVDTKVDELYDSLAYEDEDTVKAKLAEIVAGGAQPQSAAGREEVSTQNEPVDIQVEVDAAIDRRNRREWETARVAAVAQWEIDYADISSDDALRTFANEESARIAGAKPQQPIQETLKQAGEKARLWRDFQAGKVPTLDPTKDIDITARTEKKRTAAAPVRANSTAAARTVEDNKPQTRSDIVEQIRQGRGQVA